VRAALDWLQREFGLPILFAGFSFGSYVGLRACCGDPRVIGLVALGMPTHAEGRDYSYDFLRDCSQPKLFVSGTRDQYGPAATVEAASHARTSRRSWCGFRERITFLRVSWRM